MRRLLEDIADIAKYNQLTRTLFGKYSDELTHEEMLYLADQVRSRIFGAEQSGQELPALNKFKHH